MSFRSEIARRLMHVPVIGTIAAWKTDYATVLRRNQIIRRQAKDVGARLSRATDMVEKVPRSILLRGAHVVVKAARRHLESKSSEWATMQEKLSETPTPPSDTELSLRKLLHDAGEKDKKTTIVLAHYATSAAAATEDRAEYFEAVKTMGKFLHAIELSGEERVDEVLAIMARCEKVLAKTLFFIYLLLEISHGVMPTTLSDQDREFGSLRAKIEKHPRYALYPNLLPSWLRHLRNAACHGKDRYDEDQDAVLWWDRETASAPELISAVELCEKVGEVVYLSALDLPHSGQWYVLSHSPWIELLESPTFILRTLELLDDMLGTDPDRSAVAKQGLEDLAKTFERQLTKFD